ncbi:MAG TPA: SCP2 sterol-binding domain-containing protein [Thermoleophilaceae bacterium]|nr:SCP2 sterol-binding domain-containing protein [Thermoleophilaceae bacterium]
MSAQAELLERLAADDPELGARLVVMGLPAAAARIDDTLAYQLEVEGTGTWRVSVSDGRARVEPGEDGRVDFRLSCGPRELVELAAGSASPLKLAATGKIRVRGSRLKALKLRAMGNGGMDMGEVARAGARLEPDLLYRSLPWVVDPEWTRGHRFTVRYEVTGEGEWFVTVNDGERLTVSREAPPWGVAGAARVTAEGYQRLASGELTPTAAMQDRVIEVDGDIWPISLLGRWIDRGQGRDDAELEREERQRGVQQRRAGGYEAASGQLMDYRQLYALWENQNWKSTELDFSLDREQWLTTTTHAQESTLWSIGAFYVGEERVTADLAPFLLASPTGEIELFLATQLVDEARHAAFFDRFGAEVMALDGEDFRARMREMEESLAGAWRQVFDDGLRETAAQLRARPDDRSLFVKGVATYHMVVEGFLAVTGQKFVREWFADHGMYPGFVEGFGLVERDEHRHIAFGMRFLRDAVAEDPRHRQTVEDVVLDLVPKAGHVFVPPYARDPSDFLSYGYHSSEIYGYAYTTLKRRMALLGIEVPPPEQLMPGPIAESSSLAVATVA